MFAPARGTGGLKSGSQGLWGTREDRRGPVRGRLVRAGGFELPFGMQSPLCPFGLLGSLGS